MPGQVWLNAKAMVGFPILRIIPIIPAVEFVACPIRQLAKLCHLADGPPGAWGLMNCLGGIAGGYCGKTNPIDGRDFDAGRQPGVRPAFALCAECCV